jgi:hypothetical protein
MCKTNIQWQEKFLVYEKLCEIYLTRNLFSILGIFVYTYVIKLVGIITILNIFRTPAEISFVPYYYSTVYQINWNKI